jgi:hypothetical protein
MDAVNRKLWIMPASNNALNPLPQSRLERLAS